MATRTLESSPSILPLYARAAAPMIPGASLLPVHPRRRRRDPRPRPELEGVVADPADGRRLRQGLRLRPARPPPRHLPARARLPAAHGGDGRRRLPVRRGRPRPRREPDRAAPADRDRRGAGDPRPPDQAGAPPQGPDLLPADRGHGRAPRSSGRAPARCCAAASRAARRCGRQVGAQAEIGRIGRGWRRRRRQRRVEARRRPRPPLRGRLRRPQPDPHALADREAARLPGGDRARDVDQGALPGGAREPPARRLRRRRALPQADPAAGPRRVRQRHRGRGDRLRRARRQEADPSSRRPRDAARDQLPKPRPGGRSDDDHRQREERQRRRARHGLRPAAAQPPRRLRPARPHPHPQAGRARPLPGHQERLPLGDRRRPHLQVGAAAGQTGAPEEGQVEGPVRPRPRRRAADVPGGRPRLRRGRRSAPPPTTPTPTARRRRSCWPKPPSSASTCSASPRSSAASCTSSPPSPAS